MNIITETRSQDEPILGFKVVKTDFDMSKIYHQADGDIVVKQNGYHFYVDESIANNQLTLDENKHLPLKVVPIKAWGKISHWGHVYASEFLTVNTDVLID